jgi:EmrB/QacA subfamily drug resistance transporter
MTLPIARSKPGFLLAAAVLASAMGYIDSSVTAIALPAIRASLGGTLAAAQWVQGGYLLALSSLILVGGAMSDRFGVVRVFQGGIVAFVASSLLCALAPSMELMIAARALQGIGAAFMVPGSMTLVSRAYAREDRGRALGLWAAASTATTAGGPILGGLVLTLAGGESWRAIFALNLPLGLAALWLLARHARPDAGRPGTRVDVWGAVLATLCLGAFSAALTEGAALALPAAMLGAVAALAFLWVEWRSPAPMIRLSLFRNRSFAAANLATLLLYLGLNGVNFYLPMTAISAWGISPLGVTAAFLPVSLCVALFSARAGRLSDRIGPGWPMTVGCLMVALAYALMSHFAPGGDFWRGVMPFSVITGFGVALLVAPLTAAVMAHAPETEQGTASGINNATARTGGLIAVALMGRIAALSYGPLSPTMPGFALPGGSALHKAATGLAFSHVALACSGMALAAAAVSALGLLRR